MRKRMTGVIVAGVLALAGGTAAQTAGPSAEPPSRGIIPVTGPSTVPTPAEAGKPEVPAMVQGEVVGSEGAHKGSAGRRGASTAASPAPHSTKTVKAVQKPVAKTTVKKTSPAKHVAKAPGPQKTKHVASVKQVKHQSPAHHGTVSKPIPVTPRQPPTKGTAPAQPVLPRV